MGKSRLDLAMEFLVKAKKLKRKGKRDYVVQSVRHLIAWLSGDENLPNANAVNTDDDGSTYCDVCFSPRLRVGEDVCKRCNCTEKVSMVIMDEEQRKARTDAEEERMRPEIEKFDEDNQRWNGHYESKKRKADQT